MNRPQIFATKKQLAVLTQIAAACGISTTEPMWQFFDRFVKSEASPTREELVRRAKAAVGRFKAGSKPVSANHDRYLAKAYFQS